MKRNYECMVLLDNREVRKGWEPLKSAVNGYFTKHGAEIVSSKLWEERKLAYKIRQQDRGTYLMVYFNGETSSISLINREMQISETVMRHMVVACEDIPESAHEPEADFDPSKIGEDETPEPADDATEAETKASAEDGEAAKAKESEAESAPETKAEGGDTADKAADEATDKAEQDDKKEEN